MNVNGLPRATPQTEVPLSFLPGDLELVEPSGWDRPVTPLYAVAFVAGCAVCGFVVGVGLAALATSAAVKKVWDAFGW